MAELNGKVALVTGATSGIGKVTARELAKQGAHVVFTARDEQKAQGLASELKAAAPSARVDFLVVDLSVMRQVRQAAHEFKRRFDRLHLLINNAGAIYTQRETTAEGLERTFATNHLAYFLLTRELLDTVRASAPARIVNVASRAHTRARMRWDDLQFATGYSAWRAYGQSKLANVLFTRELARRLDGTGVTVNALHPGVIASGFALNTPGPMKWAWKAMSPFFSTPEEGAKTSVFLATSPKVEGKTGGYYAHQREVAPSREARDDAAARRLWEESERLLARVLQ